MLVSACGVFVMGGPLVTFQFLAIEILDSNSAFVLNKFLLLILLQLCLSREAPALIESESASKME